jgi:thiol-disulfide isomerase/thioredoxin
MIQLSVYMRSGCHLCDDLLSQLQQLQSEYSFDFHTINVDSCPKLVEQYGTKLPVVTHGDEELCHYFLDQAAVVQLVSSVSN